MRCSANQSNWCSKAWRGFQRISCGKDDVDYSHAKSRKRCKIAGPIILKTKFYTSICTYLQGIFFERFWLIKLLAKLILFESHFKMSHSSHLVQVPLCIFPKVFLHFPPAAMLGIWSFFLWCRIININANLYSLDPHDPSSAMPWLCSRF